MSYKKTPTVYQMEATECGAASLAMIFAYFGKHLSLEKMRVETGVSRDGCSAGNLMRAAQKHGLECHGYRKELDGLKKLKPPCIIHWNFEHFVVYEGTKLGHAYINDPAVGRRKLTMDELDDGFTGVVLTFKKTSKFVKERKKHRSITNITKRTKGMFGAIFRLFYVGLLLVFPGILLPVLTQAFIDDILSQGNTQWFTQFMLFMGGAILLKGGLSFYKSSLLNRIHNKMTLISSYGFLRHMMKLPMEFFDQRYIGDLISRADNNEKVCGFLAGELAETVVNLFSASFYLIVLFVYSKTLTVIGLGFVIVSVIIANICSKTISKQMMRLQQDGAKLTSSVVNGLSIISSLKASGTENEYIGRVLGYQAKTISNEQKLGRLQEIMNGVTSALDKLSDVTVLAVGAIMVIRGEFTIGMLIAFTSLFDSFYSPVSELIGFIKKIHELKADMNRVSDVEMYGVDDRYTIAKNKQIPERKLQGNIEFKSVSFGYSKLKAPLINDFSFKVLSGETIAFVGKSGCGKTTVSKLASGLYEPWDGKVLYDGFELNTIPKTILNLSIAAVNQNIVLFSDTIRDNITMWNDNILEKDYIQAAKDACIHDEIMKKPGGYDYVLSENGSNLSGGQRQRLEIARALATNPTILVLDEATSALDPIVEKQIMDNIKKRGITCIIVAHRLSTIRDCDEIVVMQEGRIIQRGTHSSLLKDKGFYSEFIKNN